MNENAMARSVDYNSEPASPKKEKIMQEILYGFENEIKRYNNLINTFNETNNRFFGAPSTNEGKLDDNNIDYNSILHRIDSLYSELRKMNNYFEDELVRLNDVV